MDLILSVLEQGLIYGIIALGTYITYRILDFPDLTVDGSFPLGMAITAVLIEKGVNPILALLVAILSGAVAGLITGVIHVKLKVRDLLAGIITMTGLYSICLTIAGKSNLPIFKSVTIFRNPLLDKLTGPFWDATKTLIVLLVVTLVAKFILDWYLKTKAGALLRAAGDNPAFVSCLGKDTGNVKIIGLAISNALVALGGGVTCQWQRFFELSNGTGTVVICLASVIIGTRLFGKLKFIGNTTAVILGSILYKGSIAVALKLGFNANNLKLITALIFLGILVAVNFSKDKGEKPC